MLILTDPKLFNYVLIFLYALNIGRWAIHGNLTDVCYWTGAFIITCAVTFGYNH